MQIVIVGENDGDKVARAIHSLLFHEDDLDVWLFPDGDDSDWAFEHTSMTRPLVLITCPTVGQMCAESEAAVHYFSAEDPELTVRLWTKTYRGRPLMMPTARFNGKKGVVLPIRVEHGASPYSAVSIVAPLVLPVITPKQPALALGLTHTP